MSLRPIDATVITFNSIVKICLAPLSNLALPNGIKIRAITAVRTMAGLSTEPAKGERKETTPRRFVFVFLQRTTMA